MPAIEGSGVHSTSIASAASRAWSMRLGDDEGDGVADMAHLVLGEDRVWRAGERIRFQVELARQVAEIADLGRGQNQRHARHPAGLG